MNARVLGLWAFCLTACAGEAVEVRQHSVPTTDMLRSEDCQLGLSAYRQLLTRPPHAGVVVTPHPAPALSLESQELAAAEFALVCQRELVGRTRRSIVRCWTDSLDTDTFRSCNDRF